MKELPRSLCLDCSTEDCSHRDLLKEHILLKCLEFKKVQDSLSFGDAVSAMKAGNKVARAGWNGTDMYCYLAEVEDMEPCIVMYTAASVFQPGWSASQADMLAEDWLLV